MVADVSKLQNLQGRKMAVRAMLRAIEELPLLLEVCAAADQDAAATQAAVAERLQISDSEAQIMLSMQVIRFTPRFAAALRAELAEIEQAIDEFG